MIANVALMSRSKVFQILAAGFLAGLLSGFFGVGGGIVLVPLILFVVGQDQRRAHATSLAAIFLIAVSGMIGYASAGEIDLGVGVALGAGGLLGAATGARLMHRMSVASLKLVFGLVLVATGLRMLI